MASKKTRTRWRNSEALKLFNKVSRVFAKYRFNAENQTDNLDTTVSTGLFDVLSSFFRRGVINYPREISDSGVVKMDKPTITTVQNKLKQEYNRFLIAQKVTGITETARWDIQQAVRKGFEEGLNSKELEESINKVVDDPNRSKRIATTETGKLINDSEFKSAQANLMDYKYWIHVGGAKTSREGHKAMDGVRAPLETLFELPNGYTCMHPLDDSLPASEVVNCHCLLGYE